MIPTIDEIISLNSDLKEKDKTLIKKAYDFAKKAHEGQLRKSGEPYFNHVFSTAINLAELGAETKTIVAGLLHDVIEDTSITEEDIKMFDAKGKLASEYYYEYKSKFNV